MRQKDEFFVFHRRIKKQYKNLNCINSIFVCVCARVCVCICAHPAAFQLTAPLASGGRVRSGFSLTRLLLNGTRAHEFASQKERRAASIEVESRREEREKRNMWCVNFIPPQRRAGVTDA